MRSNALYIAIILVFLQTGISKIIVTNLEPMPPIVIDQSEGIIIKLLEKIIIDKDNSLDVRIVPYSRAKLNLKELKCDLMGMTPYGLEAEDFYTYAQEINFRIETKTDFYCLEKNKDKINDINSLKIGIPHGNDDFASEVLGLPKTNFYPGSLDNLFKMLSAGRIDAIWFERASCFQTITNLKISNIYHKKYPPESIFAGLAVQKNEEGSKLKKSIDEALKSLDLNEIMKDYNKILNEPDEGLIEF
ncbi:MAG: transporter substrate-binding domain-containing protein [Candidatus Delongbacteria bacterium]|nr:transporter substrate-binding domain-containing protein [Candidatus Delongbacteria bacterium]MBN2833790.1 transporter substrate-binding domain-containing protein [Candidatus Delongbacteria bacterium]